MQSSDYWRQRFELLEASQTKAAERSLAGVERMFQASQRELEGQISGWYGRFADNNQISLPEARRRLNSRELAEFQWDVNEYIRHGRENAGSIDARWMRQLENASARVHITRLEALQLQTQQTMEKATPSLRPRLRFSRGMFSPATGCG